MVEDAKVEAPKLRGVAIKTPEAQPKNYPHRLPAEEWSALHSENPSSLYALRKRGWRPTPVEPGVYKKTTNGHYVCEMLKDQSPCANCGARVQEVISQDGGTRCPGCGLTPAKD